MCHRLLKSNIHKEVRFLMFWIKMEMVWIIWILILLLRFCLIMLIISWRTFSSKNTLRVIFIITRIKTITTYSKKDSLCFSPWIIISANSLKTSVSSQSAATPEISWRRIISWWSSLLKWLDITWVYFNLFKDKSTFGLNQLNMFLKEIQNSWQNETPKYYENICVS